MSDEPILRVSNLVKHYPAKTSMYRARRVGSIKAVDGVSFDLHHGETLGLVGESGCGKSTIARLLLRLEDATEGQVFFRGKNIYQMSRAELRDVRRNVQIIFQDPYSSLNPRMTIREIVSEPFDIHRGVLARNLWPKRVDELLELVGLNPSHAKRYPHQFSGGQQQRIGIARALALSPSILVCDEPVSALDVSVRSQIVNLLKRLQKELSLSYIFIAHDLAVVRHISHRVAVMYLGKIVEIGDTNQICFKATHPYTHALLSAVPTPDPFLRERRKRIVLKGQVPSPAEPPSGCAFHTRCWKAQSICTEEIPALEHRGFSHPSACHFATELPSADEIKGSSIP